MSASSLRASGGSVGSETSYSPPLLSLQNLILLFSLVPTDSTLASFSVSEILGEKSKGSESSMENSGRLTRAAAKKRSADSAGFGQEQAKKKRVVLGEISNLSNVGVSGNRDLGSEIQKPKLKGKSGKLKKALVSVEKTASEELKDVVSDEKNGIVSFLDPNLA